MPKRVECTRPRVCHLIIVIMIHYIPAGGGALDDGQESGGSDKRNMKTRHMIERWNDKIVRD